jgi:hypothetical protein
MPFVKLDCGMLDSTLWDDRDSRELFITALLMAAPHELAQATPQIAVRSLDPTGWIVPPGWYGLISAAGVGIIRRAGMDDVERGLIALERLGSPEPDSRSQDHDGRRLVRIDGGFIALNYDKYRNRDYTSAARSKRYRDRKDVTSRVATRSVTQAEAEVERESTTVAPATAQEPPPKPKPEASPIGKLLALVRKTLWAPDGKPPGEWTDLREGSVLKQLLTHHSESQLEVAILGLDLLRRGYGERPEWIAVGEKCSSRALNNTHAGVTDMMAVATRAYWTDANAKPKARQSEPERVAVILP